MQIDVVLFGWERYTQSLRDERLSVYQSGDFEAAVSAIRNADEVKVLLFDRSIAGGAGYDLAQVLRATHARSLVGQAMPAEALEYFDQTKPLPNMMDFWLGEPFGAADIVEQVAKYDRGEGGPPLGWTGWFTEPEVYDDATVDPEELAWIFEAEAENMRSYLTPESYDKWFAIFRPGIELRIRKVKGKSIGNESSSPGPS